MPIREIIEERNSEEVQDIISAPPEWILRWGTVLVFASILLIILFSSLINYPDSLTATLKVTSYNAPKEVLARKNAKLSKLYVYEGQLVKKDQFLAILETTADINDVVSVEKLLKSCRNSILQVKEKTISLPQVLNLGELQPVYEDLYQQYLQYKSTVDNGYYLKRITFLETDLKGISSVGHEITIQESIQQREHKNLLEEYKAYQKLFENKVISRSEFVQQENKYLSSKYPLQQTKTSLINNQSSYASKQKELLELKHTIFEEQAKFLQSLNKCLNEINNWTLLNVLKAPHAGTVTFAGIIQVNQNVISNQEIFIIDAGRNAFFGELKIPQYNMGKIKKGDKTLIKLHSYPYEQYGIISGRLDHISAVAYRDSVFIAKVVFEKMENKDSDHRIVLKNGMIADAQVITEESTLLQRVFRNIFKIINSN